MQGTEIKDWITNLTALTGLAGALVGIFKYFKYQSRKDRMDAVGPASPASSTRSAPKTRSSAVPRRSCCAASSTPAPEFGTAGTPYASEAVNVIAAVLREERSSNFQKLLADGLWYARSLHHADPAEDQPAERVSRLARRRAPRPERRGISFVPTCRTPRSSGPWRRARSSTRPGSRTPSFAAPI
jgi:hypothetical protein